MTTSNNTSADGSVTPTPATPVTGTPSSEGLLPQKTTLTLEEALKRISDLEHEHRNAKEAEDRLGKKLSAYEKAQKQRETEAAAEQQKQLEEQGQFKALAEQHLARVQQLEPIEQRYNALSSVLAEQLRAQVKDWPKEVTDLLPDENTPIEQRYEHAQRLQLLVNKMAEQERGRKPGMGENPPYAGQLTKQQRQTETEQRLSRSGLYPGIKRQ